MSDIITSPEHPLISNNHIVSALDVLLYSLSDLSKRQYQHTFDSWLIFADSNRIDPRNFSAQNIIAYLESLDLADSTKKARLSHLRRLLETLHAQDPSNKVIESWFKQSKMIKVKSSHSGKRRSKQALSKQEVYRVIHSYWNDVRKKKHRRNRALLSLLFYTALRRQEASRLCWEDIDFQDRILFVADGKGGKSRVVPILGEDTLNKLSQWREVVQGFTWVFVPINKGDNIHDDNPVTAQTIYNIVKETAIGCDIEFSPHDARRTAITRLLDGGTSVADARDFAGHADGKTTLLYSQRKDAQDLKHRLKMTY